MNLFKELVSEKSPLSHKRAISVYLTFILSVICLFVIWAVFHYNIFEKAPPMVKWVLVCLVALILIQSGAATIKDAILGYALITNKKVPENAFESEKTAPAIQVETPAAVQPEPLQN